MTPHVLGRNLVCRNLVEFLHKPSSILQTFPCTLHSKSSFHKPSNVNWEQCISEFENDGFTILPTRIDTDLVEKSKDLVTEALADAHQRVKTIKGHDLKVGMEHGFDEFVLRVEGRYDIMWKIRGEDHFLDQENFLSKFTPFVHHILGGEDMTRLLYNGCIIAYPGCKEQSWHADCEHLFSSENNFKFLGTNGPETSTVFDRNNTDVILPTHLLNIFIPLVDVDHTNGGTEICPGSHFQTKVFDDNINWQSPEKANEMGYAGKGVVPKLKAGEILAFDCRTLHRAIAHIGKHPRPILYYVFSKRWFVDIMNFMEMGTGFGQDDSHVPQISKENKFMAKYGFLGTCNGSLSQ